MYLLFSMYMICIMFVLRLCFLSQKVLDVPRKDLYLIYAYLFKKKLEFNNLGKCLFSNNAMIHSMNCWVMLQIVFHLIVIIVICSITQANPIHKIFQLP
jgi:hypothetical protein